jgi:hypothetical protein
MNNKLSVPEQLYKVETLKRKVIVQMVPFKYFNRL